MYLIFFWYRRDTPGIGKYVYKFYRIVMFTYFSLHTTAELILFGFDLRVMSLDELTISIAYGVQHMLAVFKMYTV